MEPHVPACARFFAALFAVNLAACAPLPRARTIRIYTDAGYFDIYVCHWPDRPLFGPVACHEFTAPEGVSDGEYVWRVHARQITLAEVAAKTAEKHREAPTRLTAD